MDNDVGELSFNGNGAEQSAPKSYTELFNSIFPYYLSIGMTYEQFWEQDAELVVFYRKADELRRKRANEDMWMQGLYIYEALCDTSPLFRDLIKGKVKAHPYCSEPKPITKLELKEKAERDAKESARRIKQQIQQVMHNMSRSDDNGNRD